MSGQQFYSYIRKDSRRGIYSSTMIISVGRGNDRIGGGGGDYPLYLIEQST